jgi:hypothetical protein
MRGNIVRKILVVLIIFAPVFSYSGCKKQAKCGCDGDVLEILTDRPAKVYFNDTGTSITFMKEGDSYSTYNFCNPSEMFSKISGFGYGASLRVSGSVYWDCTYLYQASNSGSYSYQTMMKVYVVKVTDVTDQPYGKK